LKQLRYITVFEHETLQTYENDEGRYLTTEQLDMLFAFNEKHGGRYFSSARNGIKFSQYVGVVQVGRTTIEILPKTDQGNDAHKWHNILLQMLAECKHIKRESVSEAALRRRENSLLELYIEMYLDAVEQIIHAGLTKKYLHFRQQTMALKGKLLFAQNIRKNLVHKEWFFTEHTVYTQDNGYNQVIKRGLDVVTKLNCRSYLKERASGLLLCFHNISDVRVTEKTFDKLIITRNTEGYKEPLYIAQLLILNYSPDIKSGTDDLLAILFDMNLLWQEYILLQLRKSAPEGTSVYKGSKLFWESQSIDPDIVVETPEGFHILDTKWKVLDQSKPSASDLKQMFAYNIYWNCARSILLYPKTDSGPDGSYGSFHQGRLEGHGCELAYINLLDENGGLNRNCATQIYSLMDPSVC
jgi:5-methylcytosine-specific restriction enzyme subunit McrC